MNWKKILKTTSLILPIIIIGCQANPEQSKSKKYTRAIGYLEPDNRDFTEDFKKCSDTLPIGFYHSAAPHVYKGSKRTFVKYIQENYKNQGFSDSGFLNLRFLINCRGDIGDMEVNELDNDFLPSDLNDAMVEQLINLSVNEQNWRLPNIDKPYDVYMYLIYKIENGDITEILP